MKLIFTERAMNDYSSLPAKLQSLAKKQFGFLINDLRHPSLRAKKYDESRDMWQGRINRDYRFYFVIANDEYVILSIIKHPK